MEIDCFDTAIVGSGPSGALTAAYLAEAGLSTAMIEEGVRVSDRISAFSLEEILHKYRDGGMTVALGNPKVSYIEGRCVGGGSEVNAGLYQRCSKLILESWRVTHKFEILPDELDSHFDALDVEFVGATDQKHNRVDAILSTAADNLQWKKQHVSQLQFSTSKHGVFRSKSMTMTYIPRAVNAGCQLMSGLRVDSLKQKRGECLLNCRDLYGRKRVIRAKNVFICGGAIQSAALLQRSGITHNIGRTLALHPTLKVVASFGGNIRDGEIFPGVLQIKEFSPEVCIGSSVSTMPFLGAGLVEHSNALAALTNRGNSFSGFYAMIRGTATGSVSSMPLFKNPIVRYRFEQNERNLLKNSVEKLARLLSESGANKIYLPDLERSTVSSYHLFSTVPAGENKKMTAADSFGKIHGHENIYVNDSSLFCSAIGVNPQATIMALARRNVLRFLQKK